LTYHRSNDVTLIATVREFGGSWADQDITKGGTNASNGTRIYLFIISRIYLFIYWFGFTAVCLGLYRDGGGLVVIGVGSDRGW